VNTITRLLLSAGIAFLIGMILLILMILKNEIIYLFKPLITILKTVPVASIIIVLLIWFGSGKSPLIITTLVILPIMIESFATGYKNIDRSTIEELKMVGSNNLYAIFKVYIPMIRPFIFMGLIQSMGLGIKVMVMAELISQTRYSIGNQIYLQKINLNMASLFAWTFVLVIIVVIIELFINHIKKKMLV
jgi:NitT/TauT family transport system permease protein